MFEKNKNKKIIIPLTIRALERIKINLLHEFFLIFQQCYNAISIPLYSRAFRILRILNVALSRYRLFAIDADL